MLYKDFLKETGCKSTMANFNVFRKMEYILMTFDDMTEEDAYDWGRKLVEREDEEETRICG